MTPVTDDSRKSHPGLRTTSTQAFYWIRLNGYPGFKFHAWLHGSMQVDRHKPAGVWSFWNPPKMSNLWLIQTTALDILNLGVLQPGLFRDSLSRTGRQSCGPVDQHRCDPPRSDSCRRSRMWQAWCSNTWVSSCAMSLRCWSLWPAYLITATRIRAVHESIERVGPPPSAVSWGWFDVQSKS